MSRIISTLLIITFVSSIFALPILALTNMTQPMSLQACAEGAFSTEEDFSVGNHVTATYHSDGDLLSFTGQVCATNAQLLSVFLTPQGDPPIDLGLDAVDILDVERGIVAFSTELDHPKGLFTAGDLLFTNGAIIPNTALVEDFGIPYDIGLDAAHFIGEESMIQSFAVFAPTLDRDEWTGGRLQLELQRFGIRIWFSIEGTYPRPDDDDLYDGDLLSTGGFIDRDNGDLLLSVPVAGLPDGGVDFGLDAVTASRQPGPEPFSLRFSTEILYRELPAFDDGDVLMWGGSVVTPHAVLILPFGPAARFLGLDALTGSVPSFYPDQPYLETMCDKSVADFGGGWIPQGAPAGTGLYYPPSLGPSNDEPPRRPCGDYVPIHGYLPDTGVDRFRVVYQPANNPSLPPVGIRTEWRTSVLSSNGVTCETPPSANLSTDALGWMDATAYLNARDGTPGSGYCSNPELRLAVWDTLARAYGSGLPDPDGLYRIWLEWVDTDGDSGRELFDHTIQLDNTAPQINNLGMTLPGSGESIGNCAEAPAGQSRFRVEGNFYDDYYWAYHLRVRGGNHGEHNYGWHAYHDDGNPDTIDTGTDPAVPPPPVFLREIEMNDLGEAFTACCYLLELQVRDSTIRHRFIGQYRVDLADPWWDIDFVTFSASP